MRIYIWILGLEGFMWVKQYLMWKSWQIQYLLVLAILHVIDKNNKNIKKKNQTNKEKKLIPLTEGIFFLKILVCSLKKASKSRLSPVVGHF